MHLKGMPLIQHTPEQSSPLPQNLSLSSQNA
jgi:hypothetical protein